MGAALAGRDRNRRPNAASTSARCSRSSGPTFVKFGQLLSTRPDIVPPDIIAELRALQDDVRPFPFEQVEQVVETELGLSLERAFVDFDPAPIAAASIGQVHRATLPNGKARRRQGAAPGCAAPDRRGPRAALPGRAHREGAHPRARLHRRARARRRVRPLDPAQSSTTAPKDATPSASAGNWAGDPARPGPARLLELHARARPDARVPRRASQVADVDPETYTLEERRRIAYRMSRDVDEDDLPARLLPRRSASGEHPRASGRPDRSRRLRPDREAHRRRHLEADAALHRRRERERRQPPAASRRSGRPLSEGERGRVPHAAARALLQVLRRVARGHRPDPGHPRGLPADLFDEPAAADALRDARQGDRDPRLGRHRAVPGLQRLRGREAVRALAAARAADAALTRQAGTA